MKSWTKFRGVLTSGMIVLGATGYIFSVTPIAHAQSVSTSPQVITPPPFSCTVSIDNPHGSRYWSKLNQSRIASHAWMSCTANVQSLQVTAILSQDGAIYGFGNTWIYEDSQSKTEYNTYQIPNPGPQASWKCPYVEYYNEWISQGVGYTVSYNGTHATWNSSPSDRIATVACPVPQPIA